MRETIDTSDMTLELPEAAFIEGAAALWRFDKEPEDDSAETFAALPYPDQVWYLDAAEEVVFAAIVAIAENPEAARVLAAELLRRADAIDPGPYAQIAYLEEQIAFWLSHLLDLDPDLSLLHSVANEVAQAAIDITVNGVPEDWTDPRRADAIDGGDARNLPHSAPDGLNTDSEACEP